MPSIAQFDFKTGINIVFQILFASLESDPLDLRNTILKKTNTCM